MHHFSRAGTILILSLIVAGIFIPSTVAENNTTFHGITYFTEEFPPFNYQENNSTAGIAISLLRAITKENGDEISPSDITIVPLQEGLSTVRNTTGSAIFSIAKTPERESNYRWVGPFATYDIVLYSLKSSNLTISSPEDLQNYTFGAVTSDVSIEKLSQIGVNTSKIITDQDPMELFRLLKSGKIDLVTTSDTAGKYFLKKMNESQDDYAIVYHFDSTPLYYAFNKDTPDSIITPFEQALNKLSQSPEDGGLSVREKIVNST